MRDQTANNLADVLDLTTSNPSAPAFTISPGPFGTACAPLPNDEEAAEHAQNLQELRARAKEYGFPVGP
ncbi:MAG: hypothetical protein ACR2NX_03050 [Chthoniobacterales bacterium]